MNDWEYLQVELHYRGDGNVDYIARRKSTIPATSTHQEMHGHFNIPPEQWRAYLQKLQSERWELEQVQRKDDGENETYTFKRIME